MSHLSFFAHNVLYLPSDYRRPCVRVEGHYISHDSFLFFFERRPRRSPNGTQPKLATCSEVSQILKCVYNIWGTSLKLGAQNCLFWAVLQRHRDLSENYLRNETSYRETEKLLSCSCPANFVMLYRMLYILCVCSACIVLICSFM